MEHDGIFSRTFGRGKAFTAYPGTTVTSWLIELDQGWANFLTLGPQWVLKFGREARLGAEGWSSSGDQLQGRKNIS